MRVGRLRCFCERLRLLDVANLADQHNSRKRAAETDHRAHAHREREAVDERVRLVREVAGDRFPAPELNALVQRVVVTKDRREGGRGALARRPYG